MVFFFFLMFYIIYVYWLPIRKERYRCEISGFGTLSVAVSFCWFFTEITISSDLFLRCLRIRQCLPRALCSGEYVFL